MSGGYFVGGYFVGGYFVRGNFVQVSEKHHIILFKGLSKRLGLIILNINPQTTLLTLQNICAHRNGGFQKVPGHVHLKHVNFHFFTTNLVSYDIIIFFYLWNKTRNNYKGEASF